MNVLRHSYRVVTSGTFMDFDVARRLIEPDAACVNHWKSGDINSRKSLQALV